VPTGEGPTLEDDVAAVRAWLAADEQPAIVVGHSYGGVVAGAAAAGLAQVRHLVYIASFLPQVGESLASFGDGTPAPYLDFGSDGTFGLRAEVARDGSA
jgi:pimeloyl-ACP methyl ester carboxylesterase